MKKTIFYFLLEISICFFISEKLVASAEDKESLLLPPIRASNAVPIGAGHVPVLGKGEAALAEDCRRYGVLYRLPQIRSDLMGYVPLGERDFVIRATSHFGIPANLAGPLFEEYQQYLATQQAQAPAVAPPTSVAAVQLHGEPVDSRRISTSSLGSDSSRSGSVKADSSLACSSGEEGAAASLVAHLEGGGECFTAASTSEGTTATGLRHRTGAAHKKK